MQESFSTGEIAKFCQVNLRTVIRWIEAGKIKGYKLPGRGNNRVSRAELLRFMQEYDMPIPDVLSQPAISDTILIIDDEAPFANAIQRALRKANYATVIANGGFQAGVMLKSFKPTLITLDLSMPGLSGYDVIAFIRSQEDLTNTKILVISALPSHKLKEALEAGANDVLSKPFDNKTLLNKVANLITD